MRSWKAAGPMRATKVRTAESGIAGSIALTTTVKPEEPWPGITLGPHEQGHGGRIPLLHRQEEVWSRGVD